MSKFPMGAAELFKGRHFDATVIVRCVRWYLAYKLSSRDLVEIIAERGVNLAGIGADAVVAWQTVLAA
jgi:hypothetical protein